MLDNNQKKEIERLMTLPFFPNKQTAYKLFSDFYGLNHPQIEELIDTMKKHDYGLDSVRGIAENNMIIYFTIWYIIIQSLNKMYKNIKTIELGVEKMEDCWSSGITYAFAINKHFFIIGICPLHFIEEENGENLVKNVNECFVSVFRYKDNNGEEVVKHNVTIPYVMNIIDEVITYDGE